MKISMISIASHKKRSYYSTEELFYSWSEPMIYIQLLSNIRCTLQYILNQRKNLTESHIHKASGW